MTKPTKKSNKEKEPTKEELELQKREELKEIIIVEAARAATSTIIGVLFSVVLGLLLDKKKK